MATFSTSDTVTEIVPNAGYKEIIVETPATCIDGDTVTVSLSTYGITGLLTVSGYANSSTNNAILANAPTTSVTAQTLTITVPSSGIGVMKRVYRIIGDSS